MINSNRTFPRIFSLKKEKAHLLLTYRIPQNFLVRFLNLLEMFVAVQQGVGVESEEFLVCLFSQSSESENQPAHLASASPHPGRKELARTGEENARGKPPSVFGDL